MTPEQIDQALADWQAKLGLATDSLLELDDMITYKRLRGDLGDAPPVLAGVTKKRVTPAMECVQILWDDLQALNQVITKATEHRKNISRIWGSDNSRKEIERLLTGPSISLPAIQTPLAQRGLLSAAETTRAMTPEQLLAEMTQAFDGAKKVFLDVDAAWSQLEPALAAAAQQANTLEAIATRLGVDTVSTLAEARQKIDSLKSGIAADPLGTSADISRQVTPILQNVREQLEAIKAQRDEVGNALTTARSLLEQVRAVHQQSADAMATCQRMIENPTGLCAPADGFRLADLENWLTTLEQAFQQGRWQPVKIALERWTVAANGLLASERAAFTTNNALMESRAELFGRLAAMRARAQAFVAKGGALDTNLARLAFEADDLSRRTPTPLDRLKSLVSEYEARLKQSMGR